MTFVELSAAHEHPVYACRKGRDGEKGIHSAGAHDSDHPDVRRILKPGNPRRVGCSIATPVAKESQNLRFIWAFWCHLS